MSKYDLSHLDDESLLRGLDALIAKERNQAAALLDLIAEADARRLYLTAGYTSLRAYLIEEIGFDEDEIDERIREARALRGER